MNRFAIEAYPNKDLDASSFFVVKNDDEFFNIVRDAVYNISGEKHKKILVDSLNFFVYQIPIGKWRSNKGINNEELANQFFTFDFDRKSFKSDTVLDVAELHIHSNEFWLAGTKDDVYYESRSFELSIFNDIKKSGELVNV